MESVIILAVAVVGIVTGAVCGYLFSRTRTVASETLLAAKENECATLAAEREALRGDIDRSRRTAADMQAENARLQEQLRQEGERREKMQREAELAFREIATTIIDERSKTFKESHEARLAEILNPFKENVETLKKTINDCYTGEVSEVKSLKESLRQLTELNTTISREAQELTGALRGNSKVQGDWGEMILRQILEKSGLEEGVNYTLQATTNPDGTKIVGEDGNLLRPDAVFYLPDDKSVVIDSKVSLTAYTDYVNADSDDARERMLKSHLLSVKRHVDELSGKRYDDYVKNAADFVMMFMPNEGAYMATMQGDANLWEYAYNRRVIIVSPTHLMSVLKLMYQLWTRDKQTKNALRIAEETSKMYDKFVGFVEDLERIGTALKKASSSYDDAHKKLFTGSGNLIKRVDDIRNLGIKTQKRLPVAGDDD